VELPAGRATSAGREGRSMIVAISRGCGWTNSANSTRRTYTPRPEASASEAKRVQLGIGSNPSPMQTSLARAKFRNRASHEHGRRNCLMAVKAPALSIEH
jgi:hypothetical protein